MLHLLVDSVSVCFFSSGAKYLQNSSRIQKIYIKFTSVTGMDILCNLLIFNYEDTKKYFTSTTFSKVFLYRTHVHSILTLSIKAGL